MLRFVGALPAAVNISSVSHEWEAPGLGRAAALAFYVSLSLNVTAVPCEALVL